MNPTIDAQVKALSMLMGTIMDVVSTSPMGVPEGYLYAALMTIPNFRVEHLNQMLAVMEVAGKITRSNYLVKAR